jgi:hypothetical protein
MDCPWAREIYAGYFVYCMPDGKLFKRTSLRKYDKIGNYSTAMESDVETVPNNTRTAFTFKNVKYDVDVDEKVFSVSNLDR